MAESSPVESSTMASNIDIAVATTSPSSEPFQAASIEPPQVSTEASTKHIPKRQFRKTEQKRRPITDGERKLLRDYFFKEKGGKITHKDVIKWYAETHYRTLSQSTVSESLATKFAYLDRSKASHPERKKLREGWYPALEDALFEWQQTQQGKDLTITGEILLNKAQKLWDILPQCRTEQEPKWSIGWIQNFKKRHNIRLNRYESIVRERLVASHNKQADITSFFTRKDS